MKPEQIWTAIIAAIIGRLHNGKAPGIDSIMAKVLRADIQFFDKSTGEENVEVRERPKE